MLSSNHFYYAALNIYAYIHRASLTTIHRVVSTGSPWSWQPVTGDNAKDYYHSGASMITITFPRLPDEINLSTPTCFGGLLAWEVSANYCNTINPAFTISNATPALTCLVVSTDLWGMELHRQVDVGMVVTSGSLHGVMVAYWPVMPAMWVWVPLQAQYFPFSFHTHNTGWYDHNPVQALRCMVVEHTLCMYL